MHNSMTSTSPESTINLIASLVDNSLVIQLHPNGEPRFSLLETIREFVLNELRTSGEERAAMRDHANYFLALIEASSPRLHSSVELINQVEREHSNLREALLRSIEGGELEMAHRLAVAMATLWSIHDWHLSEGREWMSRVLSMEEASELNPRALADLHQQAGVLAYLQSDYDIAREHHQQALFYARKSKDKASIGHALHGLSNVAMNQEVQEQVVVFLEECLPLARETGDNWLEAMALNNLAEVARLEGDFEQAERMFREGLELLQRIGDKFFVVFFLNGLGTLAQYKGEYAQASEFHVRCLLLSREMGDRRVMAVTLEKLAGVAAGQGRGERAARLLGAAEALRETIHSPVESIEINDYERFVSLTCAALEEDIFVESWAEGRFMGQDTAIDYALEGAVTCNLDS